MNLCGSKAPGGRRSCERPAGHREDKHAYRQQDGSLHEWDDRAHTAVEALPKPRVTLAQTGALFVTHAAAERYAEFSGLLIEGARKELTALLLDAWLVKSGEPQSWRYRSARKRLDISATIVREGRLFVVVSVNVRADTR